MPQRPSTVVPSRDRAAKRARQTLPIDPAAVHKDANHTVTVTVTELKHRNATESPLLRLPAELRIHVYELVLGGRFVHVEAERRRNACRPRTLSDALAQSALPQADALQSWDGSNRCLHYYLCRAPVTEDEAHVRSKDASADERVHGKSEILRNNWRRGDRFHVDSCRQRHDLCCSRLKDDDMPAWMFTPRDQAQRDAQVRTQLDKALSLDFLYTCSQVYQEAKGTALSANTFGFVDVLALICFTSQLTLAQSTSLRSMWLFWRAGFSSHPSDGKQWNRWLFTPKLLDRLGGLKTLHLSISIVHAAMGDQGPVRADAHDHASIHTWFLGLNLLRQLPLERVTVIVSDDPSSKFGIDGYMDRYHRISWNSLYETWCDVREDECLTADEKRQWAELIRLHLLKLNGKQIQ